MGNTGSKGTIHRNLKEIEEEEGGSTGTHVAVSEAIQDLSARLAERLRQEADQRVAALTEKHKAEMAALNEAWQTHFGESWGYVGQGGTIQLMNMLSKGFPAAQMMVCGVLGPKSNAHGPNEFLHIPYAKKLTAAVAQVIAQCP